MVKSSQPKGRLGRWMMKLQSYRFTVIYKPGRKYSNVDVLSRLETQTHPSSTLKK